MLKVKWWIMFYQCTAIFFNYPQGRNSWSGSTPIQRGGVNECTPTSRAQGGQTSGWLDKWGSSIKLHLATDVTDAWLCEYVHRVKVGVCVTAAQGWWKEFLQQEYTGCCTVTFPSPSGIKRKATKIRNDRGRVWKSGVSGPWGSLLLEPSLVAFNWTRVSGTVTPWSSVRCSSLTSALRFHYGGGPLARTSLALLIGMLWHRADKNPPREHSLLPIVLKLPSHNYLIFIQGQMRWTSRTVRDSVIQFRPIDKAERRKWKKRGEGLRPWNLVEFIS